MPYEIRKVGSQYCVFRQGTDRRFGCHPTKERARQQQKALYANESTTADGQLTISKVIPLKPPRSWFEQPEATRPTPLTVAADGRVFGHLAPWGSCHIGRMNGALQECIQAPVDSDYSGFHLGRLETAEGDEIAVGKITYGGSHAPLTADAEAARSHYDSTGQVGAFVRATNGTYGIWLSGVVRNDIPAEGLRDLKANPPSGDWRDGKLVAALAVPVPGFPIPLAVTASGDISALILSGDFQAESADYEAARDELSIRVGIKRGRAYLRQKALVAAALTAKKRKSLPQSVFAIPEERAYPIHDRAHAANALARSSGKPEAARVKRAVCRRYPDMPACK